MLRDDKTEDLARAFRLFKRVPGGLPPVADIFKKHVEKEGVSLVKQAEDTAVQKKEAKAAAGGDKGRRRRRRRAPSNSSCATSSRCTTST